MANTGKDSEAKCLRSLDWAKRTLGPLLYYRRIPDTYDLRRKNHDARTFAPKSLADFMGLYNRHAFLIEVKSSRNPRTYDTNWVRETQIESLSEYEQALGYSYILLHAKHLKVAWCMRIGEWADLIVEKASSHYLHWRNIPDTYKVENIPGEEGTAGSWNLIPILLKMDL